MPFDSELLVRAGQFAHSWLRASPAGYLLAVLAALACGILQIQAAEGLTVG